MCLFGEKTSKGEVERAMSLMSWQTLCLYLLLVSDDSTKYSQRMLTFPVLV